MNPDTCRRFAEHVRTWAEANPDVIGLIAVGSMAERGRLPDEWSDHDFWVVAADEAVSQLRDGQSWLPDAERIVLAYAECRSGSPIGLGRLGVLEAWAMPATRARYQRTLFNWYLCSKEVDIQNV